jgi:ATP-dependent DNA helicase RecG
MSARKERVVAHFSDGTGVMDLVWFNGGRYAKENYKIGTEYLVFGRPGVYNNRIQVQHPEIEKISEELRVNSEEFAAAKSFF